MDASGDADHNAVASDMGGAIALLVILFLLMLGLGAVLYNLMKQVKGYRDDTANYLALQEDGGAGAFRNVRVIPGEPALGTVQVACEF